MTRASRKGNTMATPMPTTAPEKVTKKVTVYDIETLKPVKKEYSFEHKDSETVEQAQARLASYGEAGQKRLLTVLNNTLQFFSARDARSEALGNSLSKKAVLGVVKAFRSMPGFEIKPLPGAKEITTEQYNAQTEAILAVIRTMPDMINMIVTANAGDTGEDEADETGDNA